MTESGEGYQPPSPDVLPAAETQKPVDLSSAADKIVNHAKSFIFATGAANIGAGLIMCNEAIIDYVRTKATFPPEIPLEHAVMLQFPSLVKLILGGGLTVFGMSSIKTGPTIAKNMIMSALGLPTPDNTTSESTNSNIGEEQ
jgi:hypothetical protein